MNTTALAAQTTYYISPNGSDSNHGTLSQPFKTIQKARNVIRKINSGMTGDIEVYLRGGTYQVDSAIEFCTADSGMNGYNIKYLAYNGETPVISGGTRITGWVQASGNIYRASVQSGSDFRQLYVNGKRAVLARTPNIGSYYTVAGYDENQKNILINTGDVNIGWSGLTSSVHMVHLNEWVDCYLRIGSATASGDKMSIVPKDSERGAFFARLYPEKVANRQKYYWENSMDFLDAEGEWFLNTGTNTVYYKLRQGENVDTMNVIAPKAETLLKLEGSSSGSCIHNVEFRGITFAHTNWTKPDNGYVDTQAGQPMTNDQYGYCDRPGSPAVFVKNAQYLNITRCTFTQCGSTGLDIYTGVRDTCIIGNKFWDIAGNGILVSKFSEYPDRWDTMWNPSNSAEPAQYIYIENNYLKRCGQVYYGCTGIAMGYVRHTIIRYNEISDMPYSGISMGWGWQNLDSALGQNTICYNNIYNVCNILADGGGIYNLSKNPGTMVCGNYIHDLNRNSATGTTYPISAIYLDAGTAGLNISDNVLPGTDTEAMNGDWSNVTSTNNRSYSAVTVANAGLQPEYEDLRADMVSN